MYSSLYRIKESYNYTYRGEIEEKRKSKKQEILILKIINSTKNRTKSVKKPSQINRTEKDTKIIQLIHNLKFLNSSKRRFISFQKSLFLHYSNLNLKKAAIDLL